MDYALLVIILLVFVAAGGWVMAIYYRDAYKFEAQRRERLQKELAELDRKCFQNIRLFALQERK